ncbi:hypothetical protein PVAND_007044 [Polypedilum vanderplanki]|uniref:Uncharacterized protein n=1 Tax=Polypedilum vanderplanki TaxID=319348 RepID=A0A9J6C5H8_POLVA|nr:hypothetical protein PVAND_007044 [Polypedilum vanderplanki]
MSFIKFSDLLDKSFENGTIEINSLEQLLRGLVTKLNLTKSNVDMTYVEEKDENESETIICTNNFNENMEKADSSIEGDSSNFSKSSEMSIINYFNDQYNNISFETLGVKRASNIQELPALLALPPFSFSCKQKSLNTRNIDMLNKLEFHIKKHNDAKN